MAESGITVKKTADEFSQWYTQVLTKSDMLDYYDVSGCYILKPWSFSIWEKIQRFFDDEIKKLGVDNAAFPMFIPQKYLEREKDHIEGFAAEVAWITRAGSNDIAEPIAIRPTSETAMYAYYAKWIRSHRDLPLKLNQWNSVVRWEFKTPQPFLRSREFYWQEGHTAYIDAKSAQDEVTVILDLYRQVYEDLLAVPVIPGRKSEKEKFAGGDYTMTIEGFISTNGRAIQAATSHHLGQNFSKMFDIVIEDPERPAEEGKEAGKLNVWQNSWGLSTRAIGVMVMVHGDDKGLVLPPRVAKIQVVVVPTGLNAKSTEEQRKAVYGGVDKIIKDLGALGIRAHADTREMYSPGWKWAHWELKGVPLRLDFGPRDAKNEQIVAVRRDTGVKTTLALSTLKEAIPEQLDEIQKSMFTRAKEIYDSRLAVVTEWKDMTPKLNEAKVCVIPWCGNDKCEDQIKEKTAAESAIVVDENQPSAGAKSLCIPVDQERFGSIEGKTCPCSGEPAKFWTLFGRSY